MPVNNTSGTDTSSRPSAPGRVTSMARWLARRRPAAGGAPAISIVMPVYNAEKTLRECLSRVFASTVRDFEMVIVDDGSTDASASIAATFPVRIVPTAGRVGPAAARNLGARVAEGQVLFFIDSDVMVRPDTIARLAERFERQEELDGLCGVQAVAMRHRDLVSQYKNLWMRWTYIRCTGDVPLFYTTAAAIRRERFLEAGGFDQGYATPNVEDTAFGQRLARLGMKVQVAPELEVEHVKHYSLSSLLKTDYMRAVSLALLKLRHPGDLGRNDTSVPVTTMLSVPFTLLATAAVLLGLVLGVPAIAATGVVAGAAVVAFNREFLTTIASTEGWIRAGASVPLLWLELLVSGAGAAVGLLSYLIGRRY
jgi:GT2 family glycosyltransferase